MLNIQEEKRRVNYIIENGLREILYKGLRVNNKTLGSIEDDIELLLKALQVKNLIYEYAVSIEQNMLMYDGTIIYDLIKTEEDIYSEEIKFRF